MTSPPPIHIPEVARSHGHGRVASGDERRRVAIPRRSTKGPLDTDIDDPLASSTTQASLQSPLSAATDNAPSPIDTATKTPIETQVPSKDFSFVQDPSAYHALPASNIPPPFLNAPHIPSVSTPIDNLLLAGHFRLAAIAASRNIVNAAAPTDYETLFYLLHIRLSCLCLISEHALAAQESKVLGDLNSAFYRHPLTNAHLVPWDLRILVVRLSALGYGEWRKGIMGYFELARECRESILKAETAPDQKLWRSRLRDCGIRVANVLVEMGDLEGAGRHLSGLPKNEESHDISVMETLVWLRVGDIQAAKRSLASASATEPEEIVNGTLEALIQLANSEYTAAAESFQTLHEKFPRDAMVTQNLAVCLLYVGQIAAAKTLLVDVVEASPPFHSSVFNLSTIYELCTERNREKKVALAEQLARRKVDGAVGWEIQSADFKL